MNIPNWLLSSTGEGVALRWKAFAAGLVPVLVMVGPLFGFTIAAEAWNELFGRIADVLDALVALASAYFFIRGWIRQQFYKSTGAGKFAPQISNPLEQ